MALDRRQKILLPLIFLAFAYIVWQIYDLFFSNTSVPSKESSFRPSAMVKPDHLSLHASTHQVTSDRSPSHASDPHRAALGAHDHPEGVKVQSEQTDPSLSPRKKTEENQFAMTADQTEYLRLVNRYNLLKLKHMLLEEEAAIAAAKQRIIKSRSEISSLGGNSDLIGEDDFDLEGGAPKAGYELVYLDYQNGRWNALLNRGGRFFEVHQGANMANGDHVMSVNKEGVIVNHKDQLFLVTFDGSRLVNGQDGKGGEGMSDDEIIDHLNAQSQAGVKAEQAVFPGIDKDAESDRLNAIEKRIAVPFQETNSPRRVESSLTSPQPLPREAARDGASPMVENSENRNVLKSSLDGKIKPVSQPFPAKVVEETPVKAKASKTVEKAQKWFSGIWSGQAKKPETSSLEVLTPQDEEAGRGKKLFDKEVNKTKVQPTNNKLPEPFLLNQDKRGSKGSPN